MAWDDLANARFDFEEALVRALEASAEDLELSDNGGEKLHGDEFSVTAEERDAMDEEMRCAYVARHIKNVALALGLPRPGERPAWVGTPIGLIDGLAEDVG